MARISMDLGAGAGLASGAGATLALRSVDWGTALFAGFVACFLISSVAIAAIGAILARGARSVATRPARGRDLPSRRRFAAGLAVLVLLVLAGPGRAWAAAADVAIALLPTMFVLVFGIWACVLTQRRMRASRRWWVRGAADVLVTVVTAVALVLLFDHDLLATQPAAGLLFPVGAWCSVRTWRVMTRSQRLAVRAGADTVLSLLLGTDLVLLLVWAANLLDLPRAEVAALRAMLQHAGSIADLPWWLWAGLYVLLAGAGVAAMLWPERLARAVRWSGRLHVVPSIGTVRRLLSGAHIGLLVIVLVGLTASAAVRPGLRAKLENRYAVALQRELPARAEQAAYAEIRRQFTAEI